MKRNIVLIIIVAALVGITIYQNQRVDEPKTPVAKKIEEAPQIGFNAPMFILSDLNGKKYSIPLSEKKPVVVNFWASWCGPCRTETPELVKLYQKYQGDIEIYGVNLTGSDNVEDVKGFVKEFDISYPILLDPDNQVATTYQAVGIPTTYFVDRNGLIVDKVVGLVDPDTLNSKIESLLSK